MYDFNEIDLFLTSNFVIVKIDIFLMILFCVSKKVDYFLCKYLKFSFLNK
jgi:hypothetical protein